MKATQTTTTSTSNSVRLVVLFALLLLSSVHMFGQNAKVMIAAPVAVETITVASVENAAAASTLNFVSWFMGTKQNVNTSTDIDVAGGSKKQMINSGVAPSRLLIRAFLKKASNYASAVA